MLSITIPLYLSHPLHLEFTQECLNSISTTHPYHIYLVINHASPQFTSDLQELAQRPHTSIIQNPKGNILAASWNLGISTLPLRKGEVEGVDKHFYLILNNDIILHPQAIDNLITFQENHPEILLVSGSEWSHLKTLPKAPLNESYSPHPHFSCFLITPKTIKTAGYFDENFHFGYFEDNDYHLRILLSGHQAASIDAAKFYHYGSRTIKSDDSLKAEAQKHYHLNRAYFKNKWGLDIHGQAFDPPESILEKCFPTPFNHPQNSLKDWQ